MIQLPASFEARMKKLLGDEFDSFYKSYDEPRMYGLRVNTGKITCEEFERWFLYTSPSPRDGILSRMPSFA